MQTVTKKIMGGYTNNRQNRHYVKKTYTWKRKTLYINKSFNIARRYIIIKRPNNIFIIDSTIFMQKLTELKGEIVLQ